MAEDAQEADIQSVKSEWEQWNELSLDEQRLGLPKRLAGQPLELELPRRLIDRSDIYSACQVTTHQTHMRLLCAALLLCWPSAQRKAGTPRYRGDILDFGGDAYDFLLGHGATEADILRAGTVAIRMCNQAAVAQLLSQEETRGNSATPPEGPPSSSRPGSSNGLSLGGVASVALIPGTQGT